MPAQDSVTFAKCDLFSGRMNVTDFLERLRGKRIISVGDLLNRNMWESLVCILRHGVRNKKNVREVGEEPVSRPEDTTFKFSQSVYILIDKKKHLSMTPQAELLPRRQPCAPTALEVMDDYRKALTTWAKWVDKNIDPARTQVVFRGFSLTHFRGGSGTREEVPQETEPIFNHTYLTEYPERMRILEKVMSRMKTPDIPQHQPAHRLPEGRLSVGVLVRYAGGGERMAAAANKQDCSHWWCLPGVPDTWNELFLCLLSAGKGLETMIGVVTWILVLL
ncbi:hypothetical protein ZWY2020_055677 [Hordeum vulgare]|nr:hypothetical protein ZWY2020_055677 [Hordeum vulgare]